MNEKAVNAVRDQRFYGFEATYIIDRLERTKNSLNQLVQGLGPGLEAGLGQGSEVGLEQGSGSAQRQGLGPIAQTVSTTWQIDKCVYLSSGTVDSEGVISTIGGGDTSNGVFLGTGDGSSGVRGVSSNHNLVHVCPAKAIDYAILR